MYNITYVQPACLLTLCYLIFNSILAYLQEGFLPCDPPPFSLENFVKLGKNTPPLRLFEKALICPGSTNGNIKYHIYHFCFLNILGGHIHLWFFFYDLHKKNFKKIICLPTDPRVIGMGRQRQTNNILIVAP